MKKVAIIGYGAEGKSAEKYWQNLGDDVTIRDQSNDPNYLDGLNEFDLIVRSPGVHPDKIKTIKPVTSVTREFFAKCPIPIIGVTGTKGKGTTSSLIAKILEAAGHKVWLGGNIGVPALDFLGQIKDGDEVVLELSSFQLFDLEQSPQIAVMLMIAPDHLNYHADMTEYTEAKANIFRYQKSEDLAVYYAQDPASSKMVEYSKGRHLPYFDPSGSYVKDGQVYFQDTAIMPTTEIGIVGEHNWQNVCAAVAATWNIVEDPASMRKAIHEFTGLPHRLKLVGEHSGVKYYDDSIATTPEAAIAGINAFTEPKVVILGGSDKGSSWNELAEAVKNTNVTSAIIIGQTAPAIVAALDSVGFTDYQTGLKTMPEVMNAAVQVAQPGSVVLLSPGCASFDMFENYKDRGDQFTQSVQTL
jgi:UDP-N-acetylmuramoylalanine--D-glutamate ligase